MKHQPPTTYRSAEYLLLALAALALWLGPVGVEPASAQPTMEDYWVWGRVYSAVELTPQDDLDAALRDPLSTDPEELVGAENLYPITTRNLVRVSLFDAESGNPLGSSFLTTYDGGYLIFFQTLASEPDARAVRFEVRDGVSDERLLASDPVTVRVGDNMRHLLVPGDAFEVEGVIPFAPGDDAFVFTRVGKVEVTEIDDDGFANVSPAAAAALLIPQYRDAPFGGNLYLFGAFSENLYDGNHCYQIHADGVALDRPLYKVRYTVDMATGEVTAERLKIGPIDEVPDCYGLTRLAEGTSVFWSFPDLLAIWPTAGINGEKELTVSVRRISDEATVAVVGNTSLTLFLDNNRPDVEFNRVEVRKRTPSTIGPGINLLDKPCAIVNLSDGSRFYLRYTAYHPYLRHYRLRVESNAGDAQNWARETYAGSPVGTDPAGDVLTKTSRDFKAPCVYMFHLHGVNRTTDGYRHIHWKWREVAYYIRP